MYLHLDLNLGGVTFMVAKSLSPPLMDVVVSPLTVAVYLLATRFSMKLVDLSAGLSAGLLHSRKLLSPSSELGRLRYG
jgi:hypothetical protein